MKDTFDKEFLAATGLQDDVELDFRFFLSDNVLDRDTPMSRFHDPSPIVGYKLHTGLILLRDQIMSDKSLPLIPTYNRRKNVSRSMAREYLRLERNPDIRPSEVTTLMCLRLYAREGFKIGGNTEMRRVFRYTDLAPRAYYSVGGDAYWDAMYMKKFCYDLTKLLPTCSPKEGIRYDVSRLDYHPGNTVLLYDYSSFTSSLRGMDQFTTALSSFFKGCSFQVFDPFAGPLTLDLGEVLLDYHHSINSNLLFDIGRLAEETPMDDEEHNYYMANNGPLGAQGNINLSMFLHAINITAASDSLNRQNCVGDDAIVVFNERKHNRLYFMRIINLLGSVHLDKTVFLRCKRGDTKEMCEASGWQFMKRPIVVYWDYIWIGELITFPSTSYWEKEDPIHVAKPEPEAHYNIMNRQLGSLFETCHQLQADIKGSEMEIAFIALEKIYDLCHFRQRGHFPGHVVIDRRTSIEIVINTATPALDMDNFLRPWREVLWDGIEDIGGFSDVDFSFSAMPLELDYDWTYSTKTRIMAVLSDFEYGEMKLVKRRYEHNYEDRAIWTASDKRFPIYRFRLSCEVPPSFSSLLDVYNLGQLSVFEI